MVIEAGEQDPPHLGGQGNPVVEERRRDRGLAVRRAQAQQLTGDDVDRGVEWLADRNLVQARADRSRSEHLIDERRRVRPEGGVRRVLRMDAAADLRHVDHPDVVEVGERDTQRRHELSTRGGSGRKQDAIDRLDQVDEPTGDVSDVHDPVVREHRRVPARIVVEGRVIDQGFELRPRLDRSPEPSFQVVPEVRRQVLVELVPAAGVLHPVNLSRCAYPRGFVWTRGKVRLTKST